MTVQGNNMFYGSFVSDGNPVSIEFPGPVNYYYQMNWTQWNSTANPGVLKRAWFHSSMPDGSYLGVQNTNGAATDQSVIAATGGFTPLDPRNPPTFTATAVTAVTAANPASISSIGHGLAAGDLVVFYNVTGMQQINSPFGFRVNTITNPNTFTIFLDSSGFAAAGTGGTVTKIVAPEFLDFRPTFDNINNISQAANCVVTLGYRNPVNFVVGEKYRFIVPAVFGMTEINNVIGTVVSVSAAANTVTFDVDTTGFTAFAFPASAGVPFTFPQIIPIGDSTSTLGGAVRNDGFFSLELGASVVGANADHIKWVASTRTLIDSYS